MLKTNKENLVKWSVQGKIHHPLGGNYRITFDGKPMVLPATGGISYNVKIGDSAFNWVGDHVEPGVSIRNENTTENAALTTFSCIGNEAKVVSGDAKGKKGEYKNVEGKKLLLPYKGKITGTPPDLTIASITGLGA